MPVLLKGKFKNAGRRPAVRTAEAERTMSRCALCIAIMLRCYAGTGVILTLPPVGARLCY